KWRPQIFEDIVGQKHITQTLMNAISLNRISHAYIFSGPRGVGKTTTARILAKSLNCKKGPTIHPCNRCENCIRITEGYSMDVIEIDGASNRGIDDIRDLRNKVKFAPAEGKYKVYIIDEVHMLTTEAFNALLKTLEEPPSHVIFVFATTAPHKIPKTILSRCQWFNFRRIPIQDILNKLKMISKDEELNIDDESLNAIARFSTGSMRDAESALDQVIAYCGKKIDLQSVRDVLGIIDNDIFYKLMEAIIKNKPVRGIEIINRVSDSGGDPSQFVKNLMEYVHNLSLVKYCTREAVGFRGIFAEDRERLLKQSSLIEIEKLFAIIDYLAEVERKMIYTHHPWVLLEMLVIKFTREKNYFFKEVEEDESKKEEVKININSSLKTEKGVVGLKKELVEKVKKEEGEKEKLLSKKSVQNKNEKIDISLYSKNISTNIELEKILPRILTKIKKTKISLYSFITASNSIIMEDNKLIIGFNKKNIFHKESLEKKNNKALLRELISKEIGKPLIIECVIKDKEDSSLKLGEEKSKKVTINEKNKKVEENESEFSKSDLLIKESLNLFKGKIIEG
ncbi:MAG TPA: DNA polymerase III subunit gamma/tau, partial [Candidatus Atribacteria bacterium]|nr:DNA polymerase III subunit gamma/tau [Candidatus Atribacteria bacterium]